MMTDISSIIKISTQICYRKIKLEDMKVTFFVIEVKMLIGQVNMKRLWVATLIESIKVQTK